MLGNLAPFHSLDLVESMTEVANPSFAARSRTLARNQGRIYMAGEASWRVGAVTDDSSHNRIPPRVCGQDVQEDLSGVGADVTFFLRLRLMATTVQLLLAELTDLFFTCTRYQDANGLGAMNASASREGSGP